jgi:hypothetical protein
VAFFWFFTGHNHCNVPRLSTILVRGGAEDLIILLCGNLFRLSTAHRGGGEDLISFYGEVSRPSTILVGCDDGDLFRKKFEYNDSPLISKVFRLKHLLLTFLDG